MINVNHFKAGTKVYWYTLQPGSDNGDFSAGVNVNGVNPVQGVGGPLSYASINPYSATIPSGSFKVSVPARATLYMVVGK